MIKRRLIAALLNWIDGWNTEIHNSVESRVQSEYRLMFREGAEGAGETIKNMREFYYTRITNTTNLLVGVAALLIAFVSLIVSAIALLKQ